MYKDILESTQHRVDPLPKGPWLMTQKWEHLLFMHFPVPSEVMRRHIPEGVELDTYKGVAWLTILPFKINDMRFRKMPPIPFLKSFLELNVRTYVRRNGISGIYFFSMDAEKLLAVLGARTGTLPYFHARMKMKEKKGAFHYYSTRKRDATFAFEGSYHPVSESYYPEKDSLAFWLVERYYLWSESKNALFEVGIHHKPWKIHDAEATIIKQNMAPSLSDTLLNAEPLLHYAPARRVLFWPLKKVD
ncbi:YqjF family protein [Salicibibacter kimchii]|uniref:DUF2071 domain-containing protein n=1 Tax=Salicibibacter kimchii TaxID=2099786 RepID=A0A345BXK1_9BACI|nr:DUF2071 domain-containing protein [Salicibibacter kimchii]AXF55682.1 DUF2071 domain-containing protein [Salicibibacter kimchii]